MAPSRFFSALALLALTLSAGAEDGPGGAPGTSASCPGSSPPAP